MGDETDAVTWQVVMDRLCKAMHGSTCCTYLLSDEPETLKLGAATTGSKERSLPTTVAFRDGLSGRVAAMSQVLVEESVQDSLGPESQALAQLGASCYAGFPLMAHG